MVVEGERAHEAAAHRASAVLAGRIEGNCNDGIYSISGRLIRCLHSRAAFSQQYLGEKFSGEFDSAIAHMLSRSAVNGVVTFQVQTRLDWGRPLPG